MGLLKKTNDKIKKSKEVIKKEKQKIKNEKKKIREVKINDIFKKNKKSYSYNREKKDKVSIEKNGIKGQIFSILYFEVLGFIFCLLLLFVLSGGRNYLRLYSELNKLVSVYDTITSDYNGTVDKKKIINNAIDAMIKEVGDTYTTYTNEEDTTSFIENIESTYEGIGCTVAVNEQNAIYVVSVFENSPASVAGLKEKDIILKIDDQDFQGKKSDEMAKYIKESTKDKVTLTIQRENETKKIIINREKIEIPTVNSEVLKKDDKKIGYMKISVFSSVTYEQFKSELSKLEKENIQGLIIDVRNNTGGYLSSVTNIASMFLKKGDIIYQLKSNKKTEKVKDKTKECRNYPIAVIVNTASASASEILTAAIKESYHGTIVGTNTYGKGTVQKTKKLSDGTMIKYTVEKWLTPSGNWINEVGVSPTDFSEYRTLEDIENNNAIDRQYDLALEIISKKINDNSK